MKRITNLFLEDLFIPFLKKGSMNREYVYEGLPLYPEP